jgi:hypothetical protein
MRKSGNLEREKSETKWWTQIFDPSRGLEAETYPRFCSSKSITRLDMSLF